MRWFFSGLSCSNEIKRHHHRHITGWMMMRKAGADLWILSTGQENRRKEIRIIYKSKTSPPKEGRREVWGRGLMRWVNLGVETGIQNKLWGIWLDMWDIPFKSLALYLSATCQSILKSKIEATIYAKHVGRRIKNRTTYRIHPRKEAVESAGWDVICRKVG